MSYSLETESKTMNCWSRRDAIIVFLVALSFRFLSVAVTTVTSLNTYAQADANGFAASGQRIASTIVGGSLPVLNPNDIYDVWGAMLSPFWFLPGPSRVYARIGMAVFGAVAVYNVYVIARYYHSKRAGAIAVVPLLIYPSFLFLHAVVLREAIILFGLTTTARLLLAPKLKLKSAPKYAIAAMLLITVTLLRDENLPVYLFVLAVAAVFKTKPWRQYVIMTKVTVSFGSIIGPIASIIYGRQVLNDLASLRQNRARGRTEYLGWVFPDTIPEALAFSWIGAMYFLFSPFPWMVVQIMDFIAMVEGLGNLFYASAAVSGTRILATRTLAGTSALVVGVVVGSVLYGLGTANVGTAVRHRPMILWAIFLLGGIGIAQQINVTLGDRYS